MCVYEEYYQIHVCFFSFSSGYDDEENDNRYIRVDPPGMYHNRLIYFANFTDQIQLSNCTFFHKMWFQIAFFQRWHSEGKRQPIVRKVSLHFISSWSSVHLQYFIKSKLSVDLKDRCVAQAWLAIFQATKRSGPSKLSYNLDQTLSRHPPKNTQRKSIL